MNANKIMIWMILFVTGTNYAADNWNAVTVSDTVLDFGSVSAEQSHSRQLTITNNLNEPIQVVGVAFEEDEFSTNLSAVEIPALGNYNCNISFYSKHNLNYIDFLKIELNAGNHPLIIECSAQAFYSNPYYDAAQNKSGSELKSALHNTIKDHTEFGYSTVWDILRDTDEDPNNTNNVIEIYTGWSISKNSNGGDPGEWNREHVWAKSHGDFGDSAPAGTDAHHIRPSDVQTNNDRGNKDFDNGGTQHSRATGCYYDSDSWEARDDVKGNVARMMYYMVVRYEGEEGYDLELVDFTPSTTDEEKEPLFGKQSTLYQWHQNDAVDDWERQRNNRIYDNWQGNRNPFIDYPQFTERMPSISGNDLPADEPEVGVAPVEVDMGEIEFNSTAKYYIAVINTGSAELDVTLINSTNTDFSIDQTSMNLAAETYDYLEVAYTSGETEGVFTTTIQLNSNDSDEAYIEIPLSIQVSETVSVIKPERIVSSFALYQNYPNPFNPKTAISYQLSVVSRVNLSIYNIAGQRLAILVSEKQPAGTYKVVWDASHYTGGVYIYRLQTDNGFVKARKMILLK